MNFNYNDHHNPENMKRVIKFIAVIAIIMTLVPIIRIFKVQSSDSDKRYKEYTFPVYAEIVDIVTEDNNGKPIEESPVFLYEYNGQKYRVTVLNVEKNYYSIGQTVEIKLNPSAPSRFYDPIYIKRNSNNGIKTGYIIFLLIALIPVILTVSRMRKMLKNSDTITETVMDTLETHRKAVQRELNPDNQYDSFDTYNRDDYNNNDYSDTNNYGTDNYNDSYDAYNSTDYGDSSHDTTYNDDYQSSYDTSFDSYETPKKRINVVRTDRNNTVAGNILAVISCLIFIAAGLLALYLAEDSSTSILGYIFVGMGGLVLVLLISDFINRKRKRSDYDSDSDYQ